MSMIDPNAVIHTRTGELFQPVRLYYLFHNRAATQVGFKKLRCMDYDPVKDRWMWFYQNEARNIGLDVSHANIPATHRPLILGSFYGNLGGLMYLDIPSIQRAVAAVRFFDKHLKRAAAEVRYCAVYNKIFTGADDHPGYCFNGIFGDIQTTEIERRVEENFQKLKAMAANGGLANSVIGRKFDLIEAFPVYYHEDGIDQFQTTLTMRQCVAIMRWKGNPDYCLADLISDGIKTSGVALS